MKKKRIIYKTGDIITNGKVVMMLGYRYGGNEHLKKGDWGYKTVPDYGYFRGSATYPVKYNRFSRQLFHSWIEEGFLEREMGDTPFVKIDKSLISPAILTILEKYRE